MMFIFQWVMLLMWAVSFVFYNKVAMVVFLGMFWISKLIEWGSKK